MTLLELILALALSVVVMSAVGMAIRLYFKMLEARRTSIEEMQAVRVVVQRMTNDIRAAVHPYEPDLAGLETTFQNAMQAATAQATAAAGANATASVTIGGPQQGGGQGAGGGQATGGQGAAGGQAAGGQSAGGGQGAAGGQSGGGQAQGAGGAQGASGGQGASSGGGQSAATGTTAGGAAGTSSAAGAADATAGTAATAGPTVKLTGTATELRLDISRLPRMDQYQGILSKGELSATDLPSDVKTIVYFLRSDASSDLYAGDPYAPGGEASLDGYGRGLMRAELDRAVNSYSETSGATDGVYAGAQLLAEEVVGLGFEYFDGTDFLTEWDSASQGLPRAIRIWLSVQPTYGMTDEELASAAAGKAPASTDFYFNVTLPTTPLVIPPPAAGTTAAETTDASAASSSTSTSTSTSTGTSTSAATSTGTMP